MGMKRATMAWLCMMLMLGAAVLPATQAFSGGLSPRLPGLTLRTDMLQGTLLYPRFGSPLRHPQWTMGAETENLIRRSMVSVIASIILVAAPLEQPAYASTAVAQHAAIAPIKSSLLSRLPWAVAASAAAIQDNAAVPADAARILRWRYSELLDAVEQKRVLKAIFSPGNQFSKSPIY
jgi:hypothetical protein